MPFLAVGLVFCYGVFPQNDGRNWPVHYLFGGIFMEYASNGKGNLGVTLGAIGTGLSLLNGGLGGILGGRAVPANEDGDSSSEFRVTFRVTFRVAICDIFVKEHLLLYAFFYLSKTRKPLIYKEKPAISVDCGRPFIGARGGT